MMLSTIAHPLQRNVIFKNDFSNFGQISVSISVIDSWNKMEVQVVEIALKDLRPSKIKWLLTGKFVKSYWLTSSSCSFQVIIWLAILWKGFFLSIQILAGILFIYLFIFRRSGQVLYFLSLLSGNCHLLSNLKSKL